MFVQAKCLLRGSIRKPNHHNGKGRSDQFTDVHSVTLQYISNECQTEAVELVINAGKEERKISIVDAEEIIGTGTGNVGGKNKFVDGETNGDGIKQFPARQVDLPDPSDPWYQSHKECSAATRAECKRFWAAHEGNPKAAIEHLRGFLEWRKIHQLDEHEQAQVISNTETDLLQQRQKDQQDWREVWEMTWNHSERSHLIFPEDNSVSAKRSKHPTRYRKTAIPQYIFAYPHPDPNNDGIVLQVLAARVDIRVASPEHHSLAVALYLDRKFSRRSADQRGNLWLDVRGAPGWANPSPLQFLTTIQMFAHHILRLHPERLNQLVIYPLPQWAVTVYNMIFRVLPKVIQERTLLIAGNDSYKVPLPVEKVAAKGMVAPGLIERMEQTRKQEGGCG